MMRMTQQLTTLTLGFSLVLMAIPQMSHAEDILLVGDSVVAKYPGKSSRNIYGWGESLKNLLSSKTTLKNSAIGGTTTRSYWPRFEKVLSNTKAKYVFIQFGHNDGYKPDTEGVTISDYKQYLREYVSSIKAAGGHPTLVTPPLRYNFKNMHKMYDGSITPYANAMKEVAEEENVLLLDLHKTSREFFEKEGREKSKSYYSMYPVRKNRPDITHFSERGANKLAFLIFQEICKSSDERYSNLLLAFSQDLPCKEDESEPKKSVVHGA